jgi:hypothetical protein
MPALLPVADPVQRKHDNGVDVICTGDMVSVQKQTWLDADWLDRMWRRFDLALLWALSSRLTNRYA